MPEYLITRTLQSTEAIQVTADTKQPEALRLAQKLEDDFGIHSVCDLAADELRRQHTRIAELEAQLKAVGAGRVTGLRGAAIEPDMYWISGDEESGHKESLFDAALDLAERAHPAGSRIEEKIYCAKSLPSVTLSAWYDEDEDLQYEIVGAAIAQEGGK